MKKAKEEEEDRDHVMSISLWKTSHIIREYSPKDEVGNLKIPTAWLDTVVDSFGARQLYDKHVKIMYESTKRGILDLKAVVMIFRDELQGAGLDPANIQLDGLETKPDGVHFYVIVGAHTVGAIQQHHSERPNNKVYKTVACQIIVCDNTQDNRDHARDYGTLENNLRALGKNSNGWDILWQLRQVKLQSDELDMQPADKNAWYQEQKKRIARDHNIDYQTTMGNYNSIACLKTSLFKKVKQIFEGKVHGTKFVPPTAITPFRDMSGVSDDDKEVLLSQVIGGTITLKEFKARCIFIKKTARVRDQIVNFLQEICPDETLSDWDTCCSAFEFLCNDAWFDSILGWVGSIAKEGLGVKLKQEIREKVEAATNDKPVCIYINQPYNIYYQLIIHITYCTGRHPGTPQEHIAK